MKNFVFIALLVLFPFVCLANDMEITCVKGNCEGWRIYIEKGFSSEPDMINFLNETGTVAFDINASVYYYDVFNEYIGRADFVQKGPIRSYFKYQLKLHKNVDRAECILTWAENPK